MQYKVGRTLAKSNYTETDLANFRKTASMYGVNVVTFSDKQEFVEYINDKDGENSRAEDKIYTMVFFCHGQCPKYSGSEENQLSFVLSATNSGENDTYNFTQSDIELLDKVAFNNTTTFFLL